MKLIVATCQFPVSSNVQENCAHILSQLAQAKDQGADVAHFCEGALSGYAGVDFKSFQGFDWQGLRRASEHLLRKAGELGIHIIVGSSHPLSAKNKPHNSVYVVNDKGRITTRYDKRFCYSNGTLNHGELADYSPGNHCTTFSIKGVRCGTLICHEYRYPELYRELKQKKVDLVFHSFHAVATSPRRLGQMEKQVGKKNHALNNSTTLPGITMPATMQAAAAANYIWISASNASARESLWPSHLVRPDGVVTGKLKRNVKGVLISVVDTLAEFYDSTRAWRKRAMAGEFHSGSLVDDERSIDLKSL